LNVKLSDFSYRVIFMGVIVHDASLAIANSVLLENQIQEIYLSEMFMVV